MTGGLAPRAYDWWLTDDLAAFLDRAGGFLRAEPARHTVLLTVTATLRERGPGVYGSGTPHFGACLDGGGAVCGAFVRTPPYGLLLAPLPRRAADADIGAGADAAVALAECLPPRAPELAGVTADRESAAAFAAAWRRVTGAHTEPVERMRLYRLGTLTVPAPAPPGRARTATPADRDLAARWYVEYGDELDEHGQDPMLWADSRIDYGGIVLWETPDGTPVSMAACTPRIAGQVRIGPVYTPRGRRGRGYAGGATAELSRQARDAGAEQVLLFTDLANPTSNGLYQRIGYRPVGDFDVHAFTPGAKA